jgi:hypothetical protein
MGRLGGRWVCMARVCVPLFAALCAPLVAHAASVQIGPGETYTLTGNISLDPNDTFDAEGTADSPCVIQGGQYQINAAALLGSIKIANCQVIGLGATGVPGLVVTLQQTASLDFESSTFSQCGQINVSALDMATVQMVGNDFAADAAVDPMVDNADAAEPAVTLNGGSAPLKLFTGNRVLRSFVEVYEAQHWRIGGLTEAEGNILYGQRAGVHIDYSSDITVQGNYMRTPSPWDGTNELTTVPMVGGDTQILIEHNVIRGGNGILQGAPQGEIRYNLFADPHAAWWLSGMPGALDMKVHHNLLVRSEAVETGALYWQMVGLAVTHDSSDATVTPTPLLEFYNNTMDATNCYNPPGAAVAVEPFEVIASIRNNVFFRMMYVQAAVAAFVSTNTLDMATDPGPPRMAYADYNDFFNTAAVKIDNYALSVANLTERVDAGFGLHDLGTPGLKNQQVDPKLATGMQPIQFPFSDDDIVAGNVTVCQMLAFYRNAYMPTAGSPLIDAGDPQDGQGVDIGAVGAATGTPDPNDLFGVVCPADLSKLPAIPSSTYVCPAPTSTTGGGTGAGGATPTTPPGFLCVCSVARGPSVGEGLAVLALVGLVLARRPRRRAS